MPELTPARPWLGLAGQIRTDISEDIITASFDDGINRLSIVLNNWDINGFKYSEAAFLQPGSPVFFHFGSNSTNTRKMFGGEVVSLAPNFPGNGPPVVLIEAIGVPERKQNRITLCWRQDLLEFNAVLTSGKSSVECSGTTIGNPELRNGSIISVAGVGPTFSREYFITKTIHTFDSQSGYRTRFTASTANRINPRASALDLDL